MKRIYMALLAVLLVLTVAGHGEAAALTAVKTGEPLAGGWAPAEDSALTEERLAVFEKGMAALVGVDYAPLAYLGSQVVAGTNHVFLAKGTMVVPARPVSYALVYLYEDLQGNVQILSIADLPIVPQEDGTLGPVAEELMGGWYYAEDPAFTDEDEAKLEAALQDQVGAAYYIVAYLGEQVVAGLNRCLLVRVTPVVPDARPHYALAYIYTDLQGNAALTEVVDIDVGAWVE